MQVSFQPSRPLRAEPAMNYKIACPLCQHSLSIKDPRAGKYKPKCSGCGEQFAIVVESGAGETDPPKIKVGKIAKQSAPGVEPNLGATVHADAAPAPPPAKPFQPVQPTPPAPQSASAMTSKSASAFEETAMEQPSLPPKSQASNMDATMEQPNFSSASSSEGVNPMEATINHENLPPSNISSSSNAGASRDFSVNDATMEQPPSGHSNAASSVNSSATPKPSPDKGASANSVESAKGSTSFLNKLGGYRIVKEIGAGGMGSVYLARQISLDRPCALKTIQAHWAQNPRVIARFIREAYAAAQLTHHNVVQIYDLGQDGGTNFFSMELVSGGSLDDQLKAKGKLPPKLAATFILQASRGLKFAHDHGMVHRDIKPANLMITSDGLVKIADMGLVKTPNADDSSIDGDGDVQSMMLASARSQVTAFGSSMGTPAYMAPEQSADAASVDKRADIYSLGCTFYALLTGRPPFDGNTLLEVITKHRTEKLVRPERVITGLPTALGDVIEKMTEKKPEDRYQDLGDVINDLEVYLELREDMSQAKIIHHPNDAEPLTDGSSSQAKASAQEPPKHIPPEVSPEHAGQLQLAAKQFQGSPLVLARKFAPIGWFGLCGLLSIIALFSGAMATFALIGEGAKTIANQATQAMQGAGTPTAENAVNAPAPAVVSKAAEYFSTMVSRFKSVLGYLLVLAISPIAAIAFAGFENRSPLARRWRESLIAGGIFEWAFWLFAGLVALLATYFLGLWLPLLLALVFGTAVGAAYYFGIEKPLAKARKPALDQAQTVLRQLRLKGNDEQRVRDIAAEYGGKHWEEFFESLFDYDTMRAMRTRLQQAKKTGLAVFRPRRDKLIDQWDQGLADARRQREEKIICKAEKADMVAAGVSDGEAAKRAEAMAASMVDAATETRQAMQDIASGKLTDQAAEAKRQRIKQMMAEARSGKVSAREHRSRSLDRMLGHLLGSKFRFACASLLLLATGMWVQSNQKSLEYFWQHARSTAQSTLDAAKQVTLDAKGLENATNAFSATTEQAKTAIASSPKQEWKSVWFGFVREKNVVFVALAGLLMLWGALMSGWKKSLVLAPLAVLLCYIPILLF